MLRKTALRFVLALVCFAALCAVPAGSGPIGVAMAAQSESTHDVIVFRNGKQIEGKV